MGSLSRPHWWLGAMSRWPYLFTPTCGALFPWVALAGEAVTMVALGGSITAGQGVSVPADGYIARFYAWVQARCPHCALYECAPPGLACMSCRRKHCQARARCTFGRRAAYAPFVKRLASVGRRHGDLHLPLVTQYCMPSLHVAPSHLHVGPNQSIVYIGCRLLCERVGTVRCRLSNAGRSHGRSGYHRRPHYCL